MSATIGTVNNERLPLLLESLTSVPDVLFLRQAFIKMESSEKSVDLIVINRFNNHWNNTARELHSALYDSWSARMNNASKQSILRTNLELNKLRFLSESASKHFTQMAQIHWTMFLFVYSFVQGCVGAWVTESLDPGKKKKKGILLQTLCPVKSRSVIVPPCEFNHNLHYAADDVVIIIIVIICAHAYYKKSQDWSFKCTSWTSTSKSLVINSANSKTGLKVRMRLLIAVPQNALL